MKEPKEYPKPCKRGELWGFVKPKSATFCIAPVFKRIIKTFEQGAGVATLEKVNGNIVRLVFDPVLGGVQECKVNDEKLQEHDAMEEAVRETKTGVSILDTLNGY